MSEQQTPEEIASVRFSTGGYYLDVVGVCIAMEGDNCRDGKFDKGVWDHDLLIKVAGIINTAQVAATRAAYEECYTIAENEKGGHDGFVGHYQRGAFDTAKEICRVIYVTAKKRGIDLSAAIRARAEAQKG